MKFVIIIVLLFAILFPETFVSLKHEKRSPILSKIELIDSDNVNDDEKSDIEETDLKTLKIFEFFQNLGYDPQLLIQAVKTMDFETLRKYKNFLRDKIAPLVSGDCIGDLIYHIDTLIEYANIQNYLYRKYEKIDNRTTNRNHDEFLCSYANETNRLLIENYWALDVIDSFGKPPFGLQKVNLYWPGDYEQCVGISIDKSAPNHKWQGQFSRVDLVLFNDIPTVNVTTLLDIWDHTKGDLTKLDLKEIFMIEKAGTKEHTCSVDKILKIYTCFPKTCSKRDIGALMAFLINTPQRLMGKQAICNIDVKLHDGLNILEDRHAMIVLIIILTIAVLMIFGTLYDYYVYNPFLKKLPKEKVNAVYPKDLQNSSKIIDECRQDYFNRQSNFIKIILAFSMYTNAKAIFNMSQKAGQIHCLNGIKFLSLAWIMLAHTYYWVIRFSANPLQSLSITEKLKDQYIVSGPLAVDGFYTISATLLVLLWLKDSKKTAGRHVGNMGRWTMMILHRYLRLTPVYALILVMDIYLYRYLTDGPLWNYNGIEPNFCRRSWWTNILYLNNFLRLDEQCMTWSWYLANDMQFFILSPPFLVLLWKFEKIGVIAISVLFFVTTAIRTAIILLDPLEYPPMLIMVNDREKLAFTEPFWRDVYVKPYCRCGPYLLGFMLGYILFKINLKINMKKKFLALGWLLCFGLAYWSVFGLHEYSKTAKISLVHRILWSAFGRSAWALSIVWIIFVCATGYGGFVNRFLSWKGWLPLSRLVYCTYLLHPILIMYGNMSQMKPPYYLDHYHFYVQCASNMVLSFGIALLFSLGCEMPVLSLEKLLFNPKPSPASVNRKPRKNRNGNSPLNGQKNAINDEFGQNSAEKFIEIRDEKMK